MEAGCRLALIFSLHAASSAQPAFAGHQRAALQDRLGAFFAGGEEWLVVLLDHAYTRQRFGWSELKNLDRARVDALRHIGSERNVACFLAFAEVREWFTYDDDEATEVSRDSFGARQGSELELADWIDEAGHRCEGTEDVVEDPCIVSTVPSLERHPHQIEGEPWTGNEGGNASQWYHQAAVVLVPRDGERFDEVRGVLPGGQGPPKRTVVRRRQKRD